MHVFARFFCVCAETTGVQEDELGKETEWNGEETTYGDLYVALDALAHAIIITEQLPPTERDGLDEFTRVFNKLNAILQCGGCGEYLEDWHEAQGRVAMLMGKTQEELIERAHRLECARTIAAKYRNVSKEEKNHEHII
jgi:hypothetical protein